MTVNTAQQIKHLMHLCETACRLAHTFNVRSMAYPPGPARRYWRKAADKAWEVGERYNETASKLSR